MSRSRVCNVWNQWLMIKMWFCNSIPPTDGPTSFFPNLGQRCSSCSVGIWSAFGCTSGSIGNCSKRVFKNVIWNIVLIYVDLIWNELTYGQRCLPWWSLSFLSLPNKTESRMLQSFKTSVSWARDDLRPTRFKTCYIIDSCYNIAYFIIIYVQVLNNERPVLNNKRLLLPWYSGWDLVFVSSTGSLPVFPSEVVSINVASIVVIWAAESRRQFIDVACIPSLPLRMSFERYNIHCIKISDFF